MRPTALALTWAFASLYLGVFAVPSQAAPRYISFSGRSWLVVDEREPRGPGPNVFSGRNTRVDSKGRLILDIRHEGKGWTCAHVFLAESLGYGSYELVLAPQPRELDPLAVFGFFTWDEDPVFANREIDIELARWGEAAAPNLQFTVQPWDGHPERLRRSMFDLSKGAVLSFVWKPGRIDFSAKAPEGEIRWSFPDASGERGKPLPFSVPGPGAERIGLNLWLMNGLSPLGPQRVVVESFSFEPFPLP